MVESWPEATSLDHADLRDAKDVWPELFARARARIDLAQFYLSNQPGSALERCVAALEQAAARGVKVRVLAEEKFTTEYPDTLARLAAQKNFEVRHLDWKKVSGGSRGVLHAKYIIVDGEEAYLGSQNFDYRSLQQIQEVGVRFRGTNSVEGLQQVFDGDWAAAGGTPLAVKSFPVARLLPATDSVAGASIALLYSPSPLPGSSRWDLPALVRLIDGATRSVRVQVLTYNPGGRGGAFPDLDEALRRAAARGVEVTLLVSDWAMGKGSLDHLRALAAFGDARRAEGKPGVQIKVIVIPPLASGCIPFARVAHAKYLAVDGRAAWVGTSNWERDYFFESRNVSLVIEGGALPARLEAFFLDTWMSRYTRPVQAEGEVPPVPDKTCARAGRY